MCGKLDLDLHQKSRVSVALFSKCASPVFLCPQLSLAKKCVNLGTRVQARVK